jgi:quercetin dioxygenase-like cupin family protein
VTINNHSQMSLTPLLLLIKKELLMPKATPISIEAAFERHRFLANRTPETSEEEAAGAFAMLSEYRDGAIFIGHYAGNSQWERHVNGDEIVFVIEGGTTLILLVDSQEIPKKLGQGELLVMPENTWHRFETPKAVKIMSVTPQPTDHCIERPDNA